MGDQRVVARLITSQGKPGEANGIGRRNIFAIEISCQVGL